MTPPMSMLSHQQAITQLQAENGALRIVLQLVLAQLSAPARIPVDLNWLKSSAVDSVKNGAAIHDTSDDGVQFRKELEAHIEAIFAPLVAAKQQS